MRRVGPVAVFLLFAVTLLLAASDKADIAVVVSKSPDHKTLARAVQAAGLVEALKQTGPFTVFAPTDAAFAKLPKETLDSLMKPENRPKLRSILLYHVIRGRVTAADVRKMASPTMVTTLNGAKLRVTHTADRIMVNNARVAKGDIAASNGVIHSIDVVLMPPEK